MSNKSPRKSEAKKPSKSIKEKRAEKRTKGSDAIIDPVRKVSK